MARSVPSVEVKGVDAALARIARVQAAVPLEAGAAMRAAGEFLADVAEVEAPKRTGRLASSIHVSGPYRGANTISVRVATGRLRYAQIQHWRERSKSGLPVHYSTPGTGRFFLWGPKLRLEAAVKAQIAGAVVAAVEAQR